MTNNISTDFAVEVKEKKEKLFEEKTVYDERKVQSEPSNSNMSTILYFPSTTASSSKWPLAFNLPCNNHLFYSDAINKSIDAGFGIYLGQQINGYWL